MKACVPMIFGPAYLPSIAYLELAVRSFLAQKARMLAAASEPVRCDLLRQMDSLDCAPIATATGAQRRRARTGKRNLAFCVQSVVLGLSRAWLVWICVIVWSYEGIQAGIALQHGHRAIIAMIWTT